MTSRLQAGVEEHIAEHWDEASLVLWWKRDMSWREPFCGQELAVYCLAHGRMVRPPRIVTLEEWLVGDVCLVPALATAQGISEYDVEERRSCCERADSCMGCLAGLTSCGPLVVLVWPRGVYLASRDWRKARGEGWALAGDHTSMTLKDTCTRSCQSLNRSAGCRAIAIS